MGLLTNSKNNNDPVYIPEPEPSSILSLRYDMKDGVAVVDDQPVLDENSNSVPIESILVGYQDFYGVIQEYPTRWIKLLQIITTKHEKLTTKRPVVRSTFIRGDARKHFQEAYRKAHCDNVNVRESIMKATFVPKKKTTQQNQSITTKPPVFTFYAPSNDLLTKIQGLNAFLGAPEVVAKLEALLEYDEGRNLVILNGSNDNSTIHEFNKNFTSLSLAGDNFVEPSMAIKPAALGF